MKENEKRPPLSPAEKMERKIDLAKERDSRVVICRTNDTHLLLDIIGSMDKGLNTLRRGMIQRYSADVVCAHLERVQAAAKLLHEVTEEVCKLTKVPYRPPRAFEKK